MELEALRQYRYESLIKRPQAEVEVSTKAMLSESLSLNLILKENNQKSLIAGHVCLKIDGI